MGRKKELKLYIGVQWQGLTANGIPGYIDGFLREFQTTPLSWVFPMVPFLEPPFAGCQKIITEIKKRLTSLKDSVIPMGYTGAPHTLLTRNEISRELEWSVKNPWGSGLNRIFKKKPQILIPGTPDFRREAVLQTYLTSGFQYFGIPHPPQSRLYSFFGPVLKEKLNVFHYFPLPLQTDGKISRFVNSVFPRDLSHLFLMATPAGNNTLTFLSSLIEELAERFFITFTTPDTLTEKAESDNPAPAPDFPSEPVDFLSNIADTPLSRAVREKAARIRAQEKMTNEEMKALLLATAGTPAERETTCQSLPLELPLELPPAAELSYTANMPGDIVLPGSTFDACFSGGMLKDLRFGRESFLPAGQTGSYLTIRGEQQRLQFDRIFSFEKNDIRGLETSIYFIRREERECLFILRHYVAGELPWLFVSATLSYRFETLPGFFRNKRDQRGREEIREQFRREIDEIVPFEIPVAEFSHGHTITFRSLYGDGTVAETTVNAETPAMVLSGTVFSFPCNGKLVVFGYLPNKTVPIHTIEVKTVEKQKKWTVLLNPFGTYRKSAAHETLGFGEQRSFYIGIRDEAPVKPPFFPQTVLKNIPVYQAVRPFYPIEK